MIGPGPWLRASLSIVALSLASGCGAKGSAHTDTDTDTDTEAHWAELLALDGMHWAYRARDTTAIDVGRSRSQVRVPDGFDRTGDGNQIGLAVAGYDFVLGPSGAVTEWGRDTLVEIRLFADGDAEFWLNGERIIEHSFPDLVDNGLPEFTLGTNSHVMSNHFRAVMFKRGSHFTEAELEVIYDNTLALWPRDPLPSFPYLEGAYTNTATTWISDTKTWAPPRSL